MANRLAFTILVTVLGTSTLLGACSDDEDRPNGMTGGEGGDDAGGKAGGSSGGTSAGKGGSVTGGGEMQGGQSTGQGGAAGDTGMAGEGGDTTVGGAPVGGGGGADGGMGGAGGADSPSVVYACGNQTLSRRLCSAFVARECETLPLCSSSDPPPDPCCENCYPTECVDCVASTEVDRDLYSECPACAAELDRYLHCGIDPFEAGNLNDGVGCYDYYGAYLHVENCEPILLSAQGCLDHVATLPQGECPANWPL